MTAVLALAVALALLGGAVRAMRMAGDARPAMQAGIAVAFAGFFLALAWAA